VNRWARLALTAVVAAAGLAYPFVVDDKNAVYLMSLALVLCIGAMGLNVLTGFTGQISIGHAAFFGLGAWVTANLMIETPLTFLATVPIAVAVAALAGAIVGLPALRVKGPALALVTLGLAILVPTLLKKVGGKVLWTPRPRDLKSPVTFLDTTQYHYLVPAIALLLVYVLTANLARSRAGRAMIAVRDQPLAAATAGVNVAGTKIAAFAISAGYCGLAGSMSVLIRGQADASQPLVYFQQSIYFLIAMVVGGAGTIVGPIIGGIGVQRLIDKAPDWGNGRIGLAPFILGATLVLIMYFVPDGLVGGTRRALARLRGRDAEPPEAAVAGQAAMSPEASSAARARAAADLPNPDLKEPT
jgi:branched-chain amino acid transport system permease protein